MSAPHIPVMLTEVLGALEPRDGATYLDCTFGAGGYSRAILDAADCKVMGLDRDKTALDAAAPLTEQYGERLSLHHCRFGDLEEVLTEAGVDSVDGIVLDLGVSSMQLDRAERGFSFQKDGPLDMRMGGADETETTSAADVVNTLSKDDLRRILSTYGEERRAGAIAKAIVEARKAEPFTTTRGLAALVERVLGAPRPDKIHPATRTFQALRIYVNRELSELVRALFSAERLLRAGGRLVVVSFHSLEDRIVKTFLNLRMGKGGQGSRHAPPTPDAERAPSFREIMRGMIGPTAEESAANPRARSARLRAAMRTDAAPWPIDPDRYGLIEEVRA